VALAATATTLTFGSSGAVAQTDTISGGTQPYSIFTAPNAAVATASIVASTGVLTVTPVGPGTTTIVVHDSLAASITITVTVTAMTVQINRTIVSATLGAIHEENPSYWDPITRTNLNRGNPVSGDLGKFSPSQLQSIANAINRGTLSVVSGTFPTTNETFALYNTIFDHGVAGGDSDTGITSVAAASSLQNNF
jgi:hypothetical protein